MAAALGLSELTLKSYLNEPLNAEVRLLEMGDLEPNLIRVRLASREDFERAGVERAYFLTDLKFEVVASGLDSATLIITSRDPVREPYLNFIVEARWPTGRLLREYTVLLDPPIFVGGELGATSRTLASSPSTPSSGDSQTRSQPDQPRFDPRDDSRLSTTLTPEAVDPGAGAATRYDDDDVYERDRPVTSVGDPRQGVEESGRRTRTFGESGRDGREPPAPLGSRIPKRDYTDAALNYPSTGTRYMVARGDTLWEIAEQAKPGDTSIQQTMLDILRLNPEAFQGNNINRLKAGYVIRLPSTSEITRQSFSEAVAEVRRHHRAWRAGVDLPDTRLDASEGLDVSGVASSDTGEGHLEISGGADEDTYAGNVSAREGGARAEDLDRAEREAADLSNRVGAMEEQLDMQERLISLKDEQIAALQEALANAGEDGEFAADEGAGTLDLDDDDYGLLDDDADDMQAGILDSADDPFDEPDRGGRVETVETPDTSPQQPASTPRRPSAPEPMYQKYIDMVTGNMMYMVYLAGGLLGLIILLLARKALGSLFSRNKDQALPLAGGGGDEDEFADVSLSDDSLMVDEFDEFSEAGAEPLSSFSAAPGEDAYAAQFESGDALAEADIYIAYGRYPQAVDLLKAAIAVDPSNTDYRLKLMEACVEMVESGEFQQQYADLQLIGDENVLQRARSLLEQVDGGEVWLDDLPDASITEDELSEARRNAPERPPAADSEGLGLDADTDGGDLDLDDDVLDDFSEDLDDFDSDIDDQDDELDVDLGSELEPDPVEDLDIESDLGADLDFDLDGDEDDEVELPDESADTLSAADIDEVSLESSEDLDSFDLDDEALDIEDVSLDLGEGDIDLGDDSLGMDIDDADIGLELDAGAEPDDAGLAFDDGDLDLDDDDLELDASGLELDDDIELGDGGLELEDGGLELEDGGLELDDGGLELDDGGLELDDGGLELDDDEQDSVGFGLDDAGGDDLGSELELDAEDVSFDLGSELDDFADEEITLDSAQDDLSLDAAAAELGLDEEAGGDMEEVDLGAVELPDLELDGFGDEGGDDLLSGLDGVEFDLSGADDGTDLSEIELDMSADEDDDEGMVYAADGDEIATKLDLARAYIDMGDHDGGRRILEEVVEGGNESQQQEARELLDGID